MNRNGLNGLLPTFYKLKRQENKYKGVKVCMKLKSKLFVICLAAAAIFTAAGVSANAEALDFHVTERGMT